MRHSPSGSVLQEGDRNSVISPQFVPIHAVSTLRAQRAVHGSNLQIHEFRGFQLLLTVEKKQYKLQCYTVVVLFVLQINLIFTVS